jgi:hypothetical protein
MSQDIEMQNEENNEIENLKKEYEDQLQVAVANYKKASAKLEFAFDSYEEICIKEEMDRFRQEVKSLRAKIDTL